MRRMRGKKVLVLALVVMAVFVLFSLTASAESASADAAAEEYQSNMYATAWALVPPLVAIVLALITKEVYSSLFVGILTGALFYSNFDLETAYVQMLDTGFISSIANKGHVGILVFLIVLGAIVILINRAGGSAAYGAWAVRRIKTRRGALLATTGLGCLIFVDDYFNCLTVGSVMRPVTDTHKISRAKLAYIIDATAAPVCMIAPISSWAAAVAGVVKGDENGLNLFIQAIPFNLYSLLTIGMMILIAVLNIDFGPMKKHEDNAANGDLYTTPERPYANANEDTPSSKGKVIDLVLPIVILIVLCVAGMVYTGGFFSGENFVAAFANCDAPLGLSLGSVLALIAIIVYMLCRRVLTFKDCMSSIPAGFKAMVPAILILTFAWTLSGMTSLLGADIFVSNVFASSAKGLQSFLPAMVFLVAIGLSFATGTSWGTFGILLPIVVGINMPGNLLIVAVSACLAGAVCGDHCSPISDTTIMASTGAQCDHVNHVSTQLPYALFVAGLSFLGYILAGFVRSAFVVLPVSFVLLVGILLLIWRHQKKKRVAA
ncbi:Na+/H+ antiporter NhaC family protein [Yeguia hominis]|uniref:Na+/H+ antiporter NhaC family protein n=1 Tax=Yeguia hominis TaxID=2763662 RepID=A0A926DAQ8_9FIRM|nr:Na+/H+ antiporter NhaC family protein [Yeguia hominis]MBC8534598.1 Na+/H+ antiporter NhaC family protein [Yeguia hominis]